MDIRKISFKILAIILIIVFVSLISPKTLQNDTFYTIKIGEHITEVGKIDEEDPFSWHELPYTYPHWGYDYLMYQIYNYGGFDAIYISTLVLASILGTAIYLTCCKTSKNNIISFFVTIIVLYLGKQYITARAQLVTFILFVLEINFIESFLQSKKKRYLLGLLLISISIANLHVAVWPFFFILFLPYIGEYLIYCISDSYLLGKLSINFQKLKIKLLKTNNEEKSELREKNLIEKQDRLKQVIKRTKERRRQPYKIKFRKNKAVKWLIVIFIIAIFTGFLTPLGQTPYTYLIKTMEGNTTESINEHLPLVLVENKEFLCVILVILLLLIFTNIKIKLRDLLMISGLILLAFITRRQVSMVLFIGVFVINKIIYQFVFNYDKVNLKKSAKFLSTIEGKIIITLILLIISINQYKEIKNDNYIDSSTYPVDAAQYILNNIDINKMRLYNEYNYGSYLLYKDIPVFIDSRADLYAPEFNGTNDIFSDFINTNNIGLYYEEKMEEYNITHVILYNNARINIFISRDENYEELYKDKYFVIYKRLNAKVEEG